MQEILALITPKGKSSLVSALKSAAEHLKEAPGMRDIILITDGNTNCEGDLIETARQIKEEFDYGIRYDIVGIAPSRSDNVNLYISASASRGTHRSLNRSDDIDKSAEELATVLDDLTLHTPRVVRKDDMVLIPSGEFSMGCGRDKLGWVTEQPVHPVYLDAYYMDTYEVTQKQYKDVMGKNRSFWIGSDLPVENVTWFEAKEYCEKVGKRLPTEAEWEKASKGGADHTWAGTDSKDELIGFCWIDDTGAQGMTHPVGQKKPNGYGLYDMCGNVREWVADWFDDRYYKESPLKNPLGPEKGYDRIMRGGEWDNHVYEARSCSRHTMAPDLKYGNTGFRCVRSAEEENGRED
jgi:formylglycine-generating enzyme required for sulfatase activity